MAAQILMDSKSCFKISKSQIPEESMTKCFQNLCNQETVIICAFPIQMQILVPADCFMRWNAVSMHLGRVAKPKNDYRQIYIVGAVSGDFRCRFQMMWKFGVRRCTCGPPRMESQSPDFTFLDLNLTIPRIFLTRKQCPKKRVVDQVFPNFLRS